MKRKVIIEADRTIQLTHGDYVNIYVQKNRILFNFFCDGTGNSFSLTKKELRKMLRA